MMNEIKGAKLLEGYRNLPEGDVDAVADVLLRVSAMITCGTRDLEMDLNPLLVAGAGSRRAARWTPGYESSRSNPAGRRSWSTYLESRALGATTTDSAARVPPVVTRYPRRPQSEEPQTCPWPSSAPKGRWPSYA